MQWLVMQKETLTGPKLGPRWAKLSMALRSDASMGPRWGCDWVVLSGLQ